MPRAKGEFSVAIFYPDDTHMYATRWVSSESAMNCALLYMKGSAAREGRISRIIVTDGGDNTNFEWKHGEGITFPKPTGKLVERIGNLTVLDRRDPHAFDGICAFCKKPGELRPYGPNNENICFDCAMKDEPTTARKFKEMLDRQA